MIQPHDRLCALADSLPGAIRWRFCDYEQLLLKQLRLLAPPLRLVWPPRSDDAGRPHLAGGEGQCGRDCSRPSPSPVPPAGAE